MEAWTDLYTEIAERINEKLPDIQWVDLWHEQISYLTEELPFPTPAVFVAFNTTECKDLSQLIQECEMQVDLYFFYETFSDTYAGSYNQASALDYLHTLTDLHTTFHGTSGKSYQNMRRVDMKREESGGAGNLYRISFTCNIEDASAKVVHDQKVVNEIQLTDEPIERPSTTDNEAMFVIPKM